MKSDYLKYWRVIRYFIKDKYGLSQNDLDVLLYLYSEGYFKTKDFEKFNEILSWDTKRFRRLLKEGWIVYFREPRGKYAAVYELSYKCKRMIDSIYKKLDGEEIPETTGGSGLFYKNVGYNDKRYRNFIVDMNRKLKEKRKGTFKSTKQPPHPAP